MFVIYYQNGPDFKLFLSLEKIGKVIAFFTGFIYSKLELIDCVTDIVLIWNKIK